VALPAVAASLALGTLVLSFLGGVGAALTLSVRRGGVLLSVLVLPLSMPSLIFGARAIDMAVQGESAAGPLYLLAAIAVGSVTLAPLATAAALRIALE
jgi:heme exporter protein B